MAGAIVLGAKEEFKQYLMMYVRRIGAEGLKGKVEEICKELMGDLLEDEDEREEDSGGGGGRWGIGDEIVGWNKRELLKNVILVLGKFLFINMWNDAKLVEQVNIENFSGSPFPTLNF